MPFKKGQSGNPGGRPKSTEALVDLKTVCRLHAEEAITALLKALAGPRPERAAEILLAYGFGRPLQTTQLRVIRSIDDLTDEEVAALAAAAAQEEQANGNSTKH
jgi:hypothetical protein